MSGLKRRLEKLRGLEPYRPDPKVRQAMSDYFRLLAAERRGEPVPEDVMERLDNDPELARYFEMLEAHAEARRKENA